MNIRCVTLATIAMAAVAAMFAAASQGADTVETLSKIAVDETASLDAQSIQVRGDLTRFDVKVAWRDPAQRPAGAPAKRVIRYVAQCPRKMLTVSAVATLDDNGRMLKSYMVPPGTADFSAPVEGSREAGWLAAACR